MVIPVIGVDFGDCTTIMSFIDEYDPVNRMSGVVHNLVPLRFWDGIPNVYYYSRKVGKTLCGQEAISSKAKPEQNRLRNLRRHLGEKIQIDDRIIFYDDAITEVIEHCIRVANKCLEAGWHVSTNLVSLSYPATYTFAQRQRLIELVEKATLEDGRNIKVVGTIADPAAAALDYLAEFANKDIDTTTVLTYDLGGGTFDLGLVSVYPKGRKGRDGNTYYYDIINTSGIPDLGGAEFDEVMFQLVSSKINVSLDSQMKAILKNASETAKVELSDMTDTQIQIFTANGPLDISITRTEFERVVMPLVQKTIDETRRMLNNHANQKPDIILLTGGASQMPIIMREMEKAFPDYKGKIKIHNPSVSIAYGAARYGTTEGNTDPKVQAGVKKRLDRDLGIKFYKGDSDILYISTYLKAGTEIPCETSFLESSTRVVCSGTNFNVFEAKMLNPDPLNYDSDYTYIMKVKLNFGKDVPAGYESETRLIVDSRGILTIEAREKDNPSNIISNTVELKSLS